MVQKEKTLKENLAWILHQRRTWAAVLGCASTIAGLMGYTEVAASFATLGGLLAGHSLYKPNK